MSQPLRTLYCLRIRISLRPSHFRQATVRAFASKAAKFDFGAFKFNEEKKEKREKKATTPQKIVIDAEQPRQIDLEVAQFRNSSFINFKCKDIGVDEDEAATIKKNYADAILADKLSYIRLNAAAEAIRDKKNMERFLLPGLYEFILDSKKDSITDVGNFKTLMKFSDLRTPAEWYPEARQLKRQIILHVGPTNSGKTYSALKRLEQAKTGVYSGPLRLLAHEVYERLNIAGAACNLLTGEERRESDGIEKWACTVEMTPLNREVDVAVIDEIQMIGDEQRGWAWTQAVLGVRAREIHLCGEATVIPLIQRLAETTGDTVTINKYDRLTPLHVEKKGFHNSFSNIQKGDCVVTFSRKNIFALRKKIESYGNLKAAVIYGNLPPETRAEQAKLFNDPHSGYDVLVASDAIGMGLNLNIRRVVFESISKFNGKEIVPLTVSQIKQIGGRAGRFKTQYQEGYVCTLNNGDMRRLRDALATVNPLPLASAGLYPTLDQMEKFAAELPNETFAGLLDRFEQLARLDGDYFLCNLSSQKDVADLIQHIDLSLQDRYTLVAAPSNADDPFISKAMLKFSKAISDGTELALQDMVTLPSGAVKSPEKLRELESWHKVIVLYIWLSFRFPSTFTGTESASHLKRVCEDLITQSLDQMHDKKVEARIQKILNKEAAKREKQLKHAFHNRKGPKKVEGEAAAKKPEE
ncbi:RNA helicase [Rhizoclosmatium sp. JEL0117]|nr:RNA helicase [Rhizoclosmatium sp. JEL0117]